MIRNHIVWNLNFKQIKSALAFSLPLVPGAIAYYLTTISDRILIDKYLSLAELGIYGIAATIALILNIFSFGAYKAFEPYIFKNWGKDQFSNIFQSIRNNFVYVLLIGVLLLCLFAKEFFILMTDVEFHKAYKYVPMIIIGVYSSSVGLLYGTIITARGKTKINSLIVMVGAFLSVSLNIIFLPKFGLLTAAFVSSFAMTVMLALYMWHAKFKISHIKPMLSCLLVAIVIYSMVYLFNVEHIVISILIKFVVMVLVILAVSAILKVNPIKIVKGFLSKEEKLVP
jgi:O-antigen/teichoic acid export membrane protein